MTEGTPPTSKATRLRLMEVAIELFKRHSVAGTSLQMISDELGLTKSAIYHHFRTRDELLDAILEPVLAEVSAIVEAAEAHRTVRARADHMLTGYAALAARNRDLISVLSGDPLVLELLNAKAEWRAIVVRQMRLFADVEPGVGGQIKAMILLSGFAGAARAEYSQFDGPLDEAAFRDQLIAAGRRTLGLRAPRPAD
ncbi:TetR family transcriptional regulator [Mycolicibacterium vaccae ATCC 25954]|uniref:TetR family transcriptional regulator n=2 Tax=Mycolicibacterium vaccae TaxID=1810 RepID=K0V293_MYCVA|nr:TetR family transcriptional regulator [Mycolicibacterium vaccae 95051]EJZ11450.1 TetR family transcriptional regulator [Mycolicibacterium vaccae ATCC 25954]